MERPAGERWGGTLEFQGGGAFQRWGLHRGPQADSQKADRREAGAGRCRIEVRDCRRGHQGARNSCLSHGQWEDPEAVRTIFFQHLLNQAGKLVSPTVHR